MSDLFTRTLENTFQSGTSTVEQQSFLRDLRDANRQLSSGPTILSGIQSAPTRSSVTLPNPVSVVRRGAAEVTSRLQDATGIDPRDPLSLSPVSILGNAAGIDVPGAVRSAGAKAKGVLGFLATPVGAAVAGAGAALIFTSLK